MRLFIAILFNDELKSTLAMLSNDLRKGSLKGNFTNPENYHLTLVFIGETNQIKEVQKIMDGIQGRQFSLRIGDIGYFQRPEGNIYWLGVKESLELSSIQHQLSLELQNQGFSIEERKYRPHLTLGRKVILRENTIAKLSLKPLQSQIISVGKVSLMKSERIGGKLVYTEIYAKTLAFN